MHADKNDPDSNVEPCEKPEKTPRITRRISKYLQMNPLRDYGITRMISEAREALAQIIGPERSRNGVNNNVQVFCRRPPPGIAMRNIHAVAAGHLSGDPCGKPQYQMKHHIRSVLPAFALICFSFLNGKSRFNSGRGYYSPLRHADG
jgi:hypothetical protein